MKTLASPSRKAAKWERCHEVTERALPVDVHALSHGACIKRTESQWNLLMRQ